MERLATPLRKPLATAIAIALLAASVTPPLQAAPRKGAAAPAEATAADPDAAPVPTSRAKSQLVTLNFVNADIEAVSRAIGAMLNRDILVDPRVKGNITVYNDKPQPIGEGYRNYLSALRGLGFTVVESGGFLKVVPEADAKLQTSTVSVGAPSQRGDVVLTQIFKLNYENPNNLVAVLRPLITANNTINASPGNNSLVITDYADNLQRMAKIIAALDQPQGADLQVIPLKHAVASDIAQTVQKLIDGTNATVPGMPGQGGGTSVIVENRTNSLIVRASSESRMAAALSIIQKLDQPTANGGGPAGNIWVVYLKNSDAVKMAELLRAAISAGATGNGGGGPAGGSGGAPTSDGRTTITQNPNAPSGTSGTAGGASAQSTTPVAASARPSTGGQVQADPATNSLIITASEPVYRQMRQVIDQLDVRRAQVYVEALMIQVDAQKAADIGFQWQGLLGAGGNSYVGGGTNFGSTGNLLNTAVAAGSLANSGTSTTTVTSGGTTVTTPSSILGNGLSVGWVPKINGIYTLAALAHFLETNAGGNTLSTPNLIAMDNEEAKIVVGQNIPLVTGSFTNTGSGSSSVNPFQTVERQDVGITLRLKSQIGENGTVRMTIYEENSSVSQTSDQTTNKTAVETYVTVDDGQMIALGGLIKDDYVDNVSGVPLLQSIPIIGNLFKSNTRTHHKTNLMLFLRPIVIRNQADADRLTMNRYDAIRAQQQSMAPNPGWVMRVNDSPVAPQLQPNTRLPADQPPQVQPSGSVHMIDAPPIPDLHTSQPEKPTASAPAK